MRFATNAPIRIKMVGLMLMAATGALLMAYAGMAFYQFNSLREQAVHQMSIVAALVGESASPTLRFRDRDAASAALKTLSAEPDIIAASLYLDGELFAAYRRADSTGFVFPSAREPGVQFAGSSMELVREIQEDRETIGLVFIHADLSGFKAQIERTAKVGALVLLIALNVTFFFSTRLQRFISEPILKLATVASAVSAKRDYSLRAERRNNDEIGLLINSFNEMLQEIESRDKELRRINAELEQRVESRTEELRAEAKSRRAAQKEAEQRLEYLNALIQNSPLAILVLDAQGRVEFCNSAFERLFHCSQHEIAAQIPAFLSASAEGLEEIKALTGSQSAMQCIHFTARRQRKDGREVDVEIHSVPMILEGQLSSIFAMYQDITQRKKAEAEILRAVQLAEENSRLKSEFVANMSHEIRTPMNGIIGMTELALGTNLDSEQREYLETVRASGEALLSIINDILDFSKIEAGRMDLDPIDFRLWTSFAETMKPLALRAHQKGIELVYEFAPDVPDGLIGDPGRLRQVLVNLVGNAIKFTQQGEVAITVAVEKHLQNEIILHFTVRDTGIGIPKEKQNTIFEAFAQADGSTTRLYGGTGLGLAIAARIVGLMRGKIWVESEPGAGSAFHFTAAFGIPFGQALPVAQEYRPPQLQGVRALVADDNATNRRVVKGMLAAWGMQVECVDSGKAALDLLEQAAASAAPIKLVLLDGHMPGMTGFEVAEQIKRSPSLAGATVMMLTSAGHHGDAARCRELGITAYLIKPVIQAALRESVSQALGAARRGTEAPLITRHSLKENVRPLNLLLAEDNPVNQQLARRLMEKAGHKVTVANNGVEAIEIHAQTEFDAILMDVQMPLMSGVEATVLIREREQSTGKHVPIIALTAHAMSGDRERFLAAGMDAYVTKPLNAPDLLDLLQHLKSDTGPSAKEPGAPATPSPVLNLRVASEVAGDDSEILRQMVEVYQSDLPVSMDAMAQAVAARDHAAVTFLSHRLSSALSNLGAQRALAAVNKLEAAAKRGESGLLAALHEHLRCELSLVKKELDELSGVANHEHA